jgi:HAD superfamily hydrolase (TIGR01490 family)
MQSGNILKNNIQKLAFFDFCETLVTFQTADAYIDFVRKNRGGFSMNFLNGVLILLSWLRIISVVNKFYPGNSLNKKLKLAQIKNLPYDVLEDQASHFYKEMIRPNLILPVIAEMEKLVRQDFKICLVSAGYSIYLKYFAKEFQIQHIISTDIAFDKTGKRCLGIISGKDCIGNEKVSRIRSYFEGETINLSESFAFSDSISDLPMLLLTGKGVVVSREKTQNWSKQNNFREIIWN